MGDSIKTNGIRKSMRDVILPDYLLEFLWSKFTCENKVRHIVIYHSLDNASAFSFIDLSEKYQCICIGYIEKEGNDEALIKFFQYDSHRLKLQKK